MGGWESCKVVIAMVGLQFIYAGVALFTRAAFLKGMSPRVFVVYRQGIATLTMAPIAYLSTRRNSSRSSLGLKAFSWMFVASLIGVTANQTAYFEGVYLASSTMASTMTNLIPAVTFVMAFIAGWEKINIRSLRSIAKILGTVLCVTGAISMVLLKGTKLLNAEFIPPLKSIFLSPEGDNNNNWLLGCLLLFGSSCFWSFWMILQVPISEGCPDHSYSSAWMCFLATLQSATFALSVERSLEVWSLHSLLEWGCCLYTGIGLAVSFFIQAWCISKRGPLYCAMFNPLCTIIVTIFAALFLHEEVYVGSLIGACGVIMGLYVVLWGKAKDIEELALQTNPKMENDQTKIVQVIIEEPLEKKNSKIDLEEPLLSKKSSIDRKHGV